MATQTTEMHDSSRTMEGEAPELDMAAAERFGERFMGALNEGAMVVMTSIGHRTGLFEVLAGLDGAATSEEVAEKAGLDERYVREWLAAMTAAGVMELATGPDAGAGPHLATDSEAASGSPLRYRLPAEHAVMLTGSEDNLAVFAQYIPGLSKVEDDVIRCFHEGGGVPYEQFPRFHEVMAEDSAQTVVAALHDRILPLIPGIEERLKSGIRVLDVGCGRGRALLELAATYPASEFVGYDLSDEAIQWGRARALERGLTNVTLETRDVTDFDETAEPAAFDFVTTFDAIHDQARPGAVLRGIHRTLRPGGVYLMQDIRASSHVHENLNHPIATLLYTVSCLHCMTVSLAQGGEGLGTMWGRQRALGLLEDAGFTSVEIRELEHDFMNDFYVVRP
ncbi:MAG TPA: class I SAM-dependent methyltransferase [Longimicrobiales bacterium]|nr:class I SAM-dependent methyltransferase [Longimicrobiales bacterium]